MTIPNKTSAVLYCQDFSPQAIDITTAIVLCSLIAFVGSLGNAITILVIKRAPNLQTICGVLIANLALADLLVTALSIPLMISVLSPRCGAGLFSEYCRSYFHGHFTLLYYCFGSNLGCNELGPLLGYMQPHYPQTENEYFKAESLLGPHMDDISGFFRSRIIFSLWAIVFPLY